jgi:hypothetical protein
VLAVREGGIAIGYSSGVVYILNFCAAESGFLNPAHGPVYADEPIKGTRSMLKITRIVVIRPFLMLAKEKAASREAAFLIYVPLW